MWHQDDDAPAQFYVDVCSHPKIAFPHRWDMCDTKLNTGLMFAASPGMLIWSTSNVNSKRQ